MNEQSNQVIWINTEEIQFNQGQIVGIPENPRSMTDFEYQRLKESLTKDPEFMKYNCMILKRHEQGYVVLNGNQRLKAVKDLGWDKVPAQVVPDDLPNQTLRRWILKGNIHAGEWDEFLLESWDLSELQEVGLADEIEEEPEDEGKQFEKKFLSYNDENCSYPLIPKYDESHQLFIIMVEHEVDANWLREKLNMQKMQSYKSSSTHKSNVISFDDFKKAIQEYGSEDSNTEPQET